MNTTEPVSRWLRRHDFGRRLAVVGILTAAAAGCHVKAPPQSMDESIHSRDDLAVNTQQVRLRVRALVEPLSGAIVESADRIGAGTDDPAVRRAALLWKIEAVPALREALFRPNPFAAIMDSWVLAWQMSDHFETGRGAGALGDAAPAAVTTCRWLENEIRRVAASMTVSGNVSKAAEFARSWAGEHPIRHSIASRESTLSRVGEREIAETLSTTELAGSVAVSLDDLTRRMDVYSAQLLEQSRWQAELFAMELAADYQLEKAMPLAETAVQSATETLDAVRELLPSVADTLGVAQSAPALVSQERQAAIGAAAAEISRVIRVVQEERLATLEYLSREREAVLAEVRQTIADERNAATGDVERIGVDIVDRIMLRVAQLVGGILVAVFVGAVALLFITRRVFAPHPTA